MSAVWMIRAGERGYLLDEFKRFQVVGIRWNKIGDLTSIDSLEKIREMYEKAYPDDRPGTVASSATMIYKFRAILKVGDKVVTYDSIARQYLIGSITSDYFYKPNQIQDCNHLRSVKWEGRINRDSLSASSRNSLGGISTLFSINEDVWTNIQLLLDGNETVAEEQRVEESKEELEQIREDSVERAHELIKDKILALSDEKLEQLSAAVLRAMGYRTRLSPKGPDRGVDVMASRDGLGFEEPRIKVEVKHRPKTQMGAQEIRSFLGGLRQGDKGLYISTGGFTKEAKYEADRSNIPLTLLDLDELTRLVVSYYENFDLEGRALIPLIRVYYPAE